jgi:hypothetical protein
MLDLTEFLGSLSFVVLILLLIFRVKTRRMLQVSEQMPGPKTLPLLGNVLDLGFKPEGGYIHFSGE